MKINELENEKVYADEDGYLYKFDNSGQMLIKSELQTEEHWLVATSVFPMKEILQKDYKKINFYTKEEKELVKHLVGLGFVCAAKDDDDTVFFYSRADIKKDIGEWNISSDGVCTSSSRIPNLIGSTLLDKISKFEITLLEDIIK